jgi:hypothetical protein
VPLSTEDRELIARLRASGRLGNDFLDDDKVVRVKYYRQGNFTIAIVTVRFKGRKNDTAVVGVAKRNCNDDDPNDRRGKDIALTRALRQAAQPLI